MTDKTPEGRKSDTMPLDMREEAEKLDRIITDCMNCETAHCYKPGNERCDSQKHIEQALLQAEKEGFERGIQKAIEVFRDHNGQEECRCNKSPVVHMPWNELLPSQDPREKSRIEREGE